MGGGISRLRRLCDPSDSLRRIAAPGFQYEFSPKAFIASSYSQARLYGQHSLGSDAYRYGQYVSMSGFYNIVPDLQIGLEYLYGNRADINHVHNHANRINAMLKFSF